MKIIFILNIKICAVFALILLQYTYLLGSEIPEHSDILFSSRKLPQALCVDGIKIAQKKNKKESITVYSESDTARSNKINKIINRRDFIAVKIELSDWEQEIELSVFNLLGKKILSFFSGRPVKDPENEYEFSSATLPNGIYLCVLHGANVRDAKRFVISR